MSDSNEKTILTPPRSAIRVWMLPAVLAVGVAVFPMLRVEVVRWRIRTEVAGALASTNSESRQASAWVLTQLGPLSTPELLELLRDTDDQVRSRAAQGLGRFGVRSTEPILDDLSVDPAGLFTDSSFISHTSALRAIGDPGRLELRRRITDGDEDELWIAALALYHLKSQDWQLMGRAQSYPGRPRPGLARSLGDALPPVVDVLRVALEDADGPGKQAVANMLGQLGEPGIPVLVEALSSRDSRDVAVDTLAFTGRDAVPHLVSAADHPNTNLRRAAIEALGLVFERHRMRPLPGIPTPDASIAVPVLTRAIDDPDATVRRAAVRALGQVGTKARSAVPALRVRFHDDDRGVRIKVIEAIAKLKATDDETIALLVAGLEDDDDGIRYSVATALRRLGQSTIPALVETVRNGSSTARGHAASALQKMGAPAATALTPLVESGPDDARAVAAASLGRMRSAARSALPALVGALDDESVTIRHTAMVAICRIGPAGLLEEGELPRARADALISGVSDDPNVARWAALALGLIGPPAAAATDALVEGTASSDSAVRMQSARALGLIGVDRPDVRAALVRGLSGSGPIVDWPFAWALARLAPDAALAELDSIPDPSARAAIEEFASPDGSSIYLLIRNRPRRHVQQITGWGQALSRIEVADSLVAMGWAGDSIVLAGNGTIHRLDERGALNDSLPWKPESVNSTWVAGLPGTDDIVLVDFSGNRVVWLPSPESDEVSKVCDLDARAVRSWVPLALTVDRHVVFGINQPNPGIFRVPLQAGSDAGAPLLPERGYVAACPGTNRWAATQRDGIHLFDGDREVRVIGWPAGTQVRAIAYSPRGMLVAIITTDYGPELRRLDEAGGVWRTLGPVPGGTITSMVIGPRQPWPAE